MNFYSTNLQAPFVTFRQAILQGQAPDKGLYMPVEIPRLAPDEIAAMKDQSYADLAFLVMRKYISLEEVNDEVLRQIVEDAYDFEVPIEQITNLDFLLRLDRGPTASFKDFAARALGRIMAHFLAQDDGEAIILTATSGDTGGAVADAFLGLPRVRVVILYPFDEVSNCQRRQMTTLGQNITALGVDGKFDDCQRMVKEAFADPDLAALGLSSANSINFGRLLPQAVYYCYAWSRLASSPEDQVIFSVPSGNFGNLMGGLIAFRMGLPVKHFIAAVNENDEVPRFLESGIYEKVVPSRNCLSNAMNVGHPSNFARVVALYGGVMDELGQISQEPDLERMRADISSYSITDVETKETIREAFEQFHMILEPHGAVGWAALRRYKEIASPTDPCVAIETADPAKFPEAIQEIIGLSPQMPAKMASQQELVEHRHEISAQYVDLKDFLLHDLP
ncbi:MAG TPA: threonine synthase [Candidatus Lokiarchaeia archaeon]|nr:threonine synthase [Candidatus Lokiarchaeia archaeon]